MTIDWTQVDTAAGRKIRELEGAKLVALKTLKKVITSQADAYIGRYPEAERLAWPQKEAGAQAILAGERNTALTEIVEIEAADLKIDVGDLAAQIVAKAREFRQASARLSAVRQKTEAAIEAAETVETINTIINNLTAGDTNE